MNDGKVSASEAFPAHAGMNRGRIAIGRPVQRVPRTRGDEPAELSAIGVVVLRSPHTRG